MVLDCWVILIYVSVEDGDVFDFRGMRLDWFRLQVCTQIWVIRDFGDVYLSIHSEHITLPNIFNWWAVKASDCTYWRSGILRFVCLILPTWFNLIGTDRSFLFCIPSLFCRRTQVFQKPVLVWLITRNWAKWWTPLFSTQKWSTPWWTCWWRPRTSLFSGKRHKIVKYMQNTAVKIDHNPCFMLLILQFLQPCIWKDVSAVFGTSFPESALCLLPSAVHTLHVLYTRALSWRGNTIVVAVGEVFKILGNNKISSTVAPSHRGSKSVAV